VCFGCWNSTVGLDRSDGCRVPFTRGGGAGGGVMGGCGCGCVADVMVGRYAFSWGEEVIDVSGKEAVVHTL
jgi:hypothetical protein